MIELDTFQVIRMCLTPECMYTYYQMTLQRLLKKAEDKINRELEMSTFMKRVRDSHYLCQSYEQMEIFKGLKKKYKNHYINVLNVSLDTEESIIEEN